MIAMWQNVLDKIEKLKAYDRLFCVLGAREHRYQFRPVASAKAVCAAEARLGVPLPPELKSIYLEVGNGGVGPDWGLRPVEKIRGYRPAEPFRGWEYWTETPGVDLADMAGLIAIMDRFYDHEACVVSAGPCFGHVISYSTSVGFVAGDSRTIEGTYLRWLEEETMRFELILAAVAKGASIEEIARDVGDPKNVLIRAASLLHSRVGRALAERSVRWAEDASARNPKFTINPIARVFFDRRLRRYLRRRSMG